MGSEEVRFEGRSFQHLLWREASPGPEKPLRITTSDDEALDGETRVRAEGTPLTSATSRREN